MRTREELENKLKECLEYKEECKEKGCTSSRNNIYIHYLQTILQNSLVNIDEINSLWEYYNKEIAPIYSYEDREAKRKIAEDWYRAHRGKKGSFERYEQMLPREYDEYAWCSYLFFAWITNNGENMF